jgi:RNA polymerase sigma factor (sigma-70 family)
VALVIRFPARGYSTSRMTARLLPFPVPGRPSIAPGTDPLSALAETARGGNTDAIRTLVVSVMPALLRATRGVLGAAHLEIEDVAQEAALGLVRSLSDYRRECTVTHYATRIAVLTALAARRRLRARGAGRHVPLEETDLPRAEPPSSEYLARRRRELLRNLCDALPDAQSEALLMHCALGMTVDEVAAASGVPRNTVRSRLRLAKECLREKIEGDDRLRDLLEVET